MAETPYRPAGGRHHVVVIGAGFGGLNAVQQLKNADVEITLIDKKNHHLFQPMLYQVATGMISAGEIAPSTRQLLRGQDNAHFVNGEVTDINIEDQTVTAELDGFSRTFAYDSLVVAAGAGQSYFGNDHFAEFAPGMKTLDDALELRSRIVSAFEKAEFVDDPVERERLLTFIIVGAGPTGVELTGQIAELANRTLRDQYSNYGTTSAKIYLLDGAPQVLPPFGKRLGRKAQRSLERLGVDVRLNAMVTDVTEDAVTYKNMKNEDVVTLEGATKIWSAGVSASPLGKMVADQAGVEADRAGRVSVNDDLTVGQHDNVYMVGDMISLNRLPGVAQVAIQGGAHVAKLIKAKVDEESTANEHEAFEYFDKGSMAVISRFNAVVKMGKTEFDGFPAWVSWMGLHIMYVLGFRNRTTVAVNWIQNMISRDRGNLEITDQQRIARNFINKNK
ncbi:NAD(P)/FAD-dependent oxidoreductase [Corynebacterium striatum]|uniref:NADH:ubiquinone reductase (non-electrogenic) n=1 Tax=Corynebacterium striatum TaxID=43770 RepID=A0AAQ1TVT0_CORST|nr:MULTISPECIES: NAD(P)/FAD-dependent oxidoreductase [Corynebacterium]ATZ05352.1 NAD(P)/FAD-dependent oxidoreductase [Corynebacterium striatum]ATZ07869.1 NAD(P)/FAD-dependent oxidoreductase [Corynebacterium striatum]EEI79007.1 pyridine nucleotide-disulfide oxidoreductase [Corynebacterium striatum ATCC 6940]EGT5574453.1 NAD(P)/FAD-dependent oxidoreductase [Corynebacterium striatum]EGT5591904.1 NAD(P)/FAD-dependent oxidoreductase [Corynebacterium striatum]